MHNVLCTAAAVLCTTSVGLAQSINIDVNSASGQPNASYSAAGIAGVWNTIDARPGAPTSVVRVDGEPTNVDVTIIAPAFMAAFDDGGTTGDDAALLDDGIFGAGDVATKIVINGLLEGDYNVTVYAWTPTQPNNLTLVALNDAWAAAEVVGGSWPGEFEPGVTHITRTVTVTNGTATVSITGGVWGQDGFLNGLQLRRLVAGDLDDNGVVDGADLAAVLGAWGPCPTADAESQEPCGACPADLDGDCDVNGADLAVILGHWG